MKKKNSIQITFYPQKGKKNDTNHTFLLNSLNTHKEQRVSIPRTFHLPQPPSSSAPTPQIDRFIYIRGELSTHSSRCFAFPSISSTIQANNFTVISAK